MGLDASAGSTTQPLPTIKLGSLEVSRLILGSNPFFGFSHQTDALTREMQAYFTDEQIGRTLDDAAAQGITAVAAPAYDRWIRLFNRYLEKGGRLRIWLAQPDSAAERLSADIAAAAKGGAKAIFIQGGRVDEQAAKRNFDQLRRWVDEIRGFGVPAGMAAHRRDVHLEAEKRGFPTDFYFQCVCDPTQGYRAETREGTFAAIRQIDKPVVAYKILGARRIPAPEGFEYAFRNLRAKDGVCVGMFPKNNPGEIQQNADLTRRLSR